MMTQGVKVLDPQITRVFPFPFIENQDNLKHPHFNYIVHHIPLVETRPLAYMPCDQAEAA